MNYIIISIILIIISIIYSIYYLYINKLRININYANKLLKNKYTKVIDVRTLFEWNYGHHRKSIHIPTNEINLENLNKNNIKKDDKIILYCNTGHRAKNAAEKLYNLGFKNVRYIIEPYIFLN